MYYMGEGVKKDPERAYYWLTLAAAQEKENAEVYLKRLRTELSSDTRAKLDVKAREFRPRSAGGS
jgi:TPR repeat protein